jgi:hypothetical protein
MGTFSSIDIPAHGHSILSLWTFGMMTFWHRECSTGELFGTGTLQHRNITALGHFGTRIFWQMDVSALGNFGTIQSNIAILSPAPKCVTVPKVSFCQNMYLPKCVNAEMSLFQNIRVPKFTCAKEFTCQIVSLPKPPWS